MAEEKEMEGHVEMGLLGDNFDPSLIARIRDDGYESRSGSDNFDGVSGEDDQDAGDDTPAQRSKKYHRHTPHQIQELETFFKECPHPDEKQRLELSRRLGLETKQVKFWFQNRRTQMKTQLERHENLILRQENDKLRAENSMMKEAMANPICNNCGSPAIPGQISFEEHQLRIENARLKDELNRICSLANKFLGRPISTMALPSSNSGLELAIGRNNTVSGIGGIRAGSGFPMGLDMGMMMMGNDQVQVERSMLIDLALSAMEELMKMAQGDAPLWIKTLDGENEVLNFEEYTRIFLPCLGPKPPAYVTEATRASGVVMVNSLALIEAFMDMNRWAEMFPTMIARAVPLDVISNGLGGTRNGTLLAMEAEVQLLSPLVPVRQTRFLRLCKQQAENLWAVVDVSIEFGRDPTNAHPFVTCRRLPSGCLVQDMPNGYSKVTWVEHWQYDENVVHQLYRPMVGAGIGFGAHRWIATLQRQCECLAILLSSSMPADDHTTLSQGGRRSMVKLAQRMMDNFCSGLVASSARRWDSLHVGTLGEDVKVMTRKNEGEPGDPPGIMLSAATSFWLPVSPQTLFDFLRDDRRRFEWDILSSGAGTMQEVALIVKGQTPGNCVSLLRTNGVNGNETSMVILQETCADATGSMVVYAPVDVQSLNVVMSGGDSSYVALLPSGFAIHPDGPNVGRKGSPDSGGSGGGGSVLTVGLQILVNSLPSGKLTVESIETVNNLMTATVEKIKEALRSVG
ncbi:homeobox-leucine zipper protein ANTHOCYANINLESS 2-like isoform X2 [Prosopis cineraria]|uniref:homeobox-leucine zipper protein ANTHOCYANINLESS 2-like isoform X2 n=1 Tax=Prosopis cineraria TaxID=364024 RepID=UPI00240F78C5|nr:homeobox-leucine zipper protein ANTHOCYANINLESS 2-like isoform X2 [Prosopis cineraria]